jgi:nitrous oxidase accessory protein NosD
MFYAFLLRGLSLPAHEFLRGLLFIYGVQLHQLTPNSILHIACFVNLSSGSSPIELYGNSFSASAPVYPYRRILNWAGLLFLCAPRRII